MGAVPSSSLDLNFGSLQQQEDSKDSLRQLTPTSSNVIWDEQWILAYAVISKSQYINKKTLCTGDAVTVHISTLICVKLWSHFNPFNNSQCNISHTTLPRFIPSSNLNKFNIWHKWLDSLIPVLSLLSREDKNCSSIAPTFPMLHIHRAECYDSII